MLFQRIWWWFLRRSLPFFTICLTCYRISSLFSSSVVERMNSSSCMLSWILPLKISIRSTITTIRIFISTEDRFNFYVFSMFVLNPFIVLFGNKNNKLFLNNWNMDIDKINHSKYLLLGYLSMMLGNKAWFSFGVLSFDGEDRLWKMEIWEFAFYFKVIVLVILWLLREAILDHSFNWLTIILILLFHRRAGKLNRLV